MAYVPDLRTDMPSAYGNPHSGHILSGADGASAAAGPLGHDIDTVHFRIDGSFGQDCLRGLDDYGMFMGDTGAWLHSRARHRNVRLQASPSSVRGQGSLSVLTMGSNATPFDHDLLAHALADLAAALAVDFDELAAASVRRLDVGANVPLDRPVAHVTGTMVHPPRRRLVSYGTGSAAVVTDRRQVFVYDKRAEQKAKKHGHVSAAYGTGPLARIEHRLMNRVDDQLHRPVTLGALLDPEFFADLGRQLVAEAEALRFEPAVPWKMCARTSELTLWLAGHGIERVGGLNSVLDAIEESKNQGVATTDQARALRRKAHTIAEAARADDPDDVGREFVDAVRAAVGL